MRGFIFTIDALAAAAFLIAMLSLMFLLVDLQHGSLKPEDRFASDLLEVVERAGLDKGINDGQVRGLFLMSNKCGSVLLRDAAGRIVDSVNACGCELGKEDSALRSIVRARGASLEMLVAEARACERVS